MGATSHRALLEHILDNTKSMSRKISIKQSKIPLCIKKHAALLFAWQQIPAQIYELADVFSFKQQVHGEIYEVDQNVLSVLDELEGHPKWYKRTLCEIIATDKVSGIDAGDVLQCSAYFLTNFAQTFLSQDFRCEYTVQEHNLTYTEKSNRNKYCDVVSQSQEN